MAQGNYVNVGSIDANWGKGLSSALLGLSDTYAKKAANEREEARLASEAEESKRRFDLQDARAAANAELQQDEAQRQLKMRDYYSTLGSNMNLDDVKTAKLKQYFNVTDEDLTGPKGRQVLDAVPLYQEDVIDYYNKDFVRKFGTGFDPKVLQSFVGDLQSIAGLQAQEDEAAKAKREAYKEVLNRNVDIAKALYKEESGLSPKSSGPATYADIDISKLAGSFDKSGSWVPFSESEAEKANTIGTSFLETLKSEGYSPSVASRIVEATFNKLRRGDALNEIENNPELATQTLNEVKKEISDYEVLRNNASISNAKSYLDNFLTNNELIGTYLPKNVRLANRAAAQQTINSILGREVLTPSPTTSTKGVTEEEILSRIGFNTEPKESDRLEEITVTAKRKPSLEVQGRIDTYNKDAQVVEQLKSRYGNDILEGRDTVFVYPYDNEGKPKDWEEVALDINKANGIFLGDSLSAEEIEKAKNNPKLQQEYIDRANRLIGSNAKFESGTSGFLQTAGNRVSNLLDRFRTPTTREELQDFENRQNNLNENLAANFALDRLITDRTGRNRNIAESLSDFVLESPSAQATLGAAALGSLPIMGAAAAPIIRGGSALIKSAPRIPFRSRPPAPTPTFTTQTRIIGENPFLVGPQLSSSIAPNLNIPAITRFQRAMQYGPVKP